MSKGQKTSERAMKPAATFLEVATRMGDPLLAARLRAEADRGKAPKDAVKAAGGLDAWNCLVTERRCGGVVADSASGIGTLVIA